MIWEIWVWNWLHESLCIHNGTCNTVKLNIIIINKSCNKNTMIDDTSFHDQKQKKSGSSLKRYRWKITRTQLIDTPIWRVQITVATARSAAVKRRKNRDGDEMGWDGMKHPSIKATPAHKRHWEPNKLPVNCCQSGKFDADDAPDRRKFYVFLYRWIGT